MHGHLTVLKHFRKKALHKAAVVNAVGSRLLLPPTAYQ